VWYLIATDAEGAPRAAKLEWSPADRRAWRDCARICCSAVIEVSGQPPANFGHDPGGGGAPRTEKLVDPDSHFALEAARDLTDQLVNSRDQLVWRRL